MIKIGKQEIYDFLKRNKKKAYRQSDIQKFVSSNVKWEQLNSLVKCNDISMKHQKKKIGNRRGKNKIKYFKYKR